MNNKYNIIVYWTWGAQCYEFYMALLFYWHMTFNDSPKREQKRWDNGQEWLRQSGFNVEKIIATQWD